jgi:tRNA pseudouridine55 synthase
MTEGAGTANDADSVSRRAHGPRARRGYRDIDGILVLDKPIGLSSNAALQAARRIFSARKAGHTGSLDPLASGVLPLCFGQATKVSGWLLDAAKTYEVTARLGVRTDTGDSDGQVVEESEWRHVDADRINQALVEFRGEIEQVPPMYSALKHQGRRLYQMAREGKVVERPPRKIRITELEILDFEKDSLRLHVSCSKGTYVRSLVEDLALRLDTLGHVTALRRIVAGPFDASMMVTIQQIESAAAKGQDALDQLLYSADAAVPQLSAVNLDSDSAHRLCRGQRLMLADPAAVGRVRIYGPEGVFLGLGELNDSGTLSPIRLFNVPASNPGSEDSGTLPGPSC